MKITDLRVGNSIKLSVFQPKEEKWLHHDTEIHTLSEDQVKIKHGFLCEITEIYGIPLTPEWMIKLGFEATYFKSDNSFDTWVIRGQRWFTDNYELVWFDTKALYVHEIQNIYFSLTGKELVI